MDALFEWLGEPSRAADRGRVIRSMVFPAALSDFLRFLYEALFCAGKAKLIVSCSLIRKRGAIFAISSGTIPVRCWRPNEQEASRYTKKRITAALEAMGVASLFDARFIAQLRYDKSSLMDSRRSAIEPRIYSPTTKR